MVTGKKKLESKYNSTSGGFRSYEIYDLDSKNIFKVANLISEKFPAEFSAPIIGLDEVYIDFNIRNNKFTLGWDIWSGIFIMALDLESNRCVEEIGIYLDSKIDVMEKW